MKVHIVRAVWVFNAGSDRFGDFILQFLDGSNALHFTAFAAPYGQRCAPIPFSRDGPIFHVAKPFTKPSFTHPIGSPLNLVVEFEEVFLDRRHADKPGIHSVVEERVVRAPTMRVVVEVGLFTVQQATLRAGSVGTSR